VRASDLRSQLGSTVDEQTLMRLLEKQAELLTDNSQLREQRRTLRQEITDLKSKVAPEGARILAADEAPLWDAYTALGTPDALKQSIDANGEATAKLARLERSEQLRKAADASGYKAGVLERLAGDLPIELREIEGKPVAFVKDDTGERLLTEHATTAWADFLPALRADATSPGTSYVAQSAGNTQPVGDKAAQFIAAQEERRKAQPNPLMKQGVS
jgi:hypothetical protein